jgi:hypothetical protein
MKFNSKDTAQRCKKTGEIMPLIRCGCVCGCMPDKGFLKIDKNNIAELKQARWNGTHQKFYASVWMDGNRKDLESLGYY